MTPWRLGAVGFAMLACGLDFVDQAVVDVGVILGIAVVLALLDIASSFTSAVNITLDGQQLTGVEIHDKLLRLKERTGRDLGLG